MFKQIELFRTKNTNFFSVVAKFHLPCVRAYYQYDNLYMLPSCVTSMMTSLNIDYNYFCGKFNPITILAKYISRGYGIILNSQEIEYLKNDNSPSIKVNNSDIICKPVTLCGSKEAIHPFYVGIEKDINDSLKPNYIKSYEELIKLVDAY